LGFDDLRERLLSGGIAPRHVRRYLRELDEHLDDLTAQQRQAGYDGEVARLRARARLGSETELAAAMLEQKQFRSLAARAPGVVFLILPPIAALAIGMLLIGSLVLTGKYFGFMPMSASSTPAWYQLLATGMVFAANLTMMPVTAILFVAIAQHQRLKLVWPLTATLILLALFFYCDVKFASHGKGHLMIGAGPFFMRESWTMLAAHWRLAMVQYALTLLPILWLWRRRLAKV
jgi:hypothetical protein